jgi:cystathionine beta-lyase
MEPFLLNAGHLRARNGGKWKTHPADVLPAWVAEMDFKVAPAVQEVIEHFTDLQDYGYGQMTDAIPLFESFAAWMSRRHGWQPDPALTHATTDVVQGLVATMVAFSQPGDGVIAQTPVYPPFLRFTASTGRRVVENPLIDDGQRFVVDLDGLEQAAASASMILLCNPHNPTGRVFERAELEGIARIAADHDLTIVSDEIHADLIYPGPAHIPMETIPGAISRTVTLTSATKGFNIPGLRTAIAHFGSAELKERFDKMLPDHLLGGPSRFGVAATIAAWRDGEAWLDEVMLYLDRNRAIVAEWATRNQLVHHVPESTYLAWLGCRHLKLQTGATPQQYFLEDARVALSEGADFGEPGQGHVRLNFATSTEILEEILTRLSATLT